MLATMDGNDSLKRLIRRETVAPQDDREPALGEVRERKDDRDGRGDYILSPAVVDRWENDVDEEMIADVVRIFLYGCAISTYTRTVRGSEIEQSLRGPMEQHEKRFIKKDVGHF